MANRRITVSWSGAGLTFSNDRCRIRSGSRLRWHSNDVDFAVFFTANESPFLTRATVLAGEKSVGTKYLTIRHLARGENSLVVKKSHTEKAFKYCVAILDPATDTMVTVDPDIIIEDYG